MEEPLSILMVTWLLLLMVIALLMGYFRGRPGRRWFPLLLLSCLTSSHRLLDKS